MTPILQAMKRLLATLSLLALLVTPSFAADCEDMGTILKIAQSKAPDAHRIQIMNAARTQAFLKRAKRQGGISKLPEPLENYVEAVVIESEMRGLIYVGLISKNTPDEKVCWAITLPTRFKADLYN